MGEYTVKQVITFILLAAVLIAVIAGVGSFFKDQVISFIKGLGGTEDKMVFFLSLVN